MISTRIISIFFFIVSFGLFACAKPIDTSNGLAVRSTEADLATRTYPSSPCGCDQDLLDVLVDLKVKVDVQLALLDGHNSPTKPCQDIIAAINVAIKLIADIKITLPLITAHITAIVDILVYIIVNIAVCLNKYSLLLTVTLCLQIDICLAGLVNVCVGLIPSLLALITAGVKVHLDLLVTLKLVLTIAACGL